MSCSKFRGGTWGVIAAIAGAALYSDRNYNLHMAFITKLKRAVLFRAVNHGMEAPFNSLARPRGPGLLATAISI